MSDVRPYQTSDLALAAFLLYKGMVYLKPIQTGTERLKFVFLDSPEKDNWIELFNTGQEDLISPKVYAKCLHKLNKDLRTAYNG